MSMLITEGVILRKYFLRETSYILVIFTKDHGKIRGVLKGVRKPYPQFAGNFEILTKCGVHFYKKERKSLDLISHCEAMDSFLAVRKDIERLTYANYFIELIDVIAGDYDENWELYEILLDGLECLGRHEAALAKRIFDVKILSAAGFKPRLDSCGKCSSKEDTLLFDIVDGTLLCPSCRSEDSRCYKLHAGTLDFIRTVSELGFEEAVSLGASAEYEKEVDNILKNFIIYHVGAQLKSARF
ncbi:MAG: DNA repair protein RecO, partial [Candidatus Omnitrophica bacterium]|nr:DNA repair protein RecO [Candidatus Omnitrophota bacterium]